MLSIIEKHYINNRDTLVKRFTRRAGSPQNAEDVVQQAYYNAIKYKDSFVMGMDFGAWFNRIINNTLRRMKRAETQSTNIFEEEVDDEDPLFTNAVKGSVVKDIKSIEDETVQYILSLYFLHGYTMKEVMLVTNLEYKFIDNAVFKFKKHIKERYG